MIELSPSEVLEKLKLGNERFARDGGFLGDASKEKIKDLAENGQSPLAVVVACSDSRVVPEAIFSSGAGELFVVRTAGNVVGESETGSIEYAVRHLGVKLVIVLGHTHCGAIEAAIEGVTHGHVGVITREIIESTRDMSGGDDLCERNVVRQVAKVKKTFGEVSVIGGIYDLNSGKVGWVCRSW